LPGGALRTASLWRVGRYLAGAGWLSDIERDERSSVRDRAAERRDALDRARDVAAAGRDDAAEARDDEARLRERYARDALWADELRAEVEAHRRRWREPDAGSDARLEQALIDGEVARSHAAMTRTVFRAFLQQTRDERSEAEADRQASRHDRMNSDESRREAAQDRAASAQDRDFAAAERTTVESAVQA
jgi:hypothetical protein